MKNLITLGGLLLFLCFSATNANSQTETIEDEYFVRVEEYPSFPGGQDSMFSFIGKNVVYPHEARVEKIEGRVIISFIVEKDGSLSSINLLKGTHESLDAEGLRVVRSMPAWLPGRQDGKPVRVKITLPITFKL